MKLRNLLIAGALFLGLASYIFFFERPSKTGGPSELLRDSVLSVHSADVQALTLGLGQQPIALEKKDGRWMLLGQQTLEADEDTVNSILSELEFLSAARVIRPEGNSKTLDLAQYGLSDSKKQIGIRMAAGEKKLVFGKPTPIGNNVYAAVQGQPEVYVIAQGLEQSLDKTPEELRNHVMMEVDMDQMDSLTISNVKGNFTIQKDKSGTTGGFAWKWKNPVGDKQLDQEAFSSALWELRRLKAKKILQDSTAGLPSWDKPLVQAQIDLNKEAQPKRLIVGNALPDGTYICRTEGKPEIFTLESYQVEPLTKDFGKKSQPAAQSH